MNPDKFYATLRAEKALALASMTQTQVDVLNRIMAAMDGRRTPEVAYVMATAYHEAKLTPKRENMNYTSASRIRAVWPSRFPNDAAAQPFVREPVKLALKVYGARDDLGNVKGTPDGWIFRGGGLDQLTGRVNYERIGIADWPDQILQPGRAVQSLVDGMTTGRYRGHKLSDFINARSVDYRGARAIVNADVAANGERVAGYARAFERALTAAGWGAAPTVPVIDAVPALPAASGSGIIAGLLALLRAMFGGASK